ncbi:hypothetical protein BY996DRAFT_6910501, partial [Phakopsora pachyrhizi]
FVHETPRSNAVYHYHCFQFGRTFNFLHTYAIHLNLSHGFTYLSLLLMSALPTRATTNRQKQNLAAINHSAQITEDNLTILLQGGWPWGTDNTVVMDVSSDYNFTSPPPFHKVTVWINSYGHIPIAAVALVAFLVALMSM